MMSPPRAAGGEGTEDSQNGFFEDVLCLYERLFTRSLGGVSVWNGSQLLAAGQKVMFANGGDF